MNEIDLQKFRTAVLDQLDATRDWVDRDEIAWLRVHPDEPLTSVNIDGEFDFAALLERLNS